MVSECLPTRVKCNARLSTHAKSNYEYDSNGPAEFYPSNATSFDGRRELQGSHRLIPNCSQSQSHRAVLFVQLVHSETQ